MRNLTRRTPFDHLMKPSEIDIFQGKILSFYDNHGRSMPWRTDTSPYAVFVSEMMLQQTQVSRVEKYFTPFCQHFPDFQTLANSPLHELLLAWKGLGYNRRARFMRESAGIVQREHGGSLPDDPAMLVRLPGIGVNTAGSIAAFAYNRPAVFIETNIRRVFIHEFFPGESDISDKELLPLIEATLPADLARIWYWALMDYGVHLKKEGREAARRSRHYNRQSAFAGSVRQLRAAILHELAACSPSAVQGIHMEALSLRLKKAIPEHPFTYELLHTTLEQLTEEGFLIAEDDFRYKLET